MLATVAVSGVALWASFASFSSATHLNASRSAVDSNDLPSAAANARKAIDATPWAAEPRIQLALVQELAGQYREALKSVGEAIHRSPNTGTYWVLQARLYLRLNMLAPAQLSFGRAKELDPKNAIASQA